MNDPTDLPADRVPLGPDLKLFGGKASALLDDLPPLPPRPSPPPKLPEPAKGIDPPKSAELPAAEQPSEPSAAAPPPAPQPRWVKEAISTLLQPSRRKVAVAVGMVSLAGGGVAVRLLLPPKAVTPPTAAETAAKKPEEPAAQLAATNPPATAPATIAADPNLPTVTSITVPAVTTPAATNTPGSVAAPELPQVALQVPPPATAAIPPPAPLPKITAEPMQLPPAVGLPTPAALPTPAPVDAWNPLTAFDPATAAVVRTPASLQPRYFGEPGTQALVRTLKKGELVVSAAAADRPAVARLDAAVVQAGAAEPAPPTIPAVPPAPASAAPAVPLSVPAPVIPQPAAPAVAVTPPKDKELPKPAADLPKPAAPVAPLAGGVPTPPVPGGGAPGVALPPAVPLPTPGVTPIPEAKGSPFKDVAPPAVEQPRLAPPTVEPTAPPPATLDLTKPSGAAAITPAAATAPPTSAAKPTPFSFDVDFYTPKANDTYDSVSKLHYGDPRYGKALEAFNAERGGRLGDGRDVEVPPVYVLRQPRYARFIGASRPTQPEPVRDRGADWAPAGGREPAQPRGPFTVGPRGATFRQVAESVYGDSRQWSRIWELNPKFRADEELPGGTTLKLPADAPRPRPAADR